MLVRLPCVPPASLVRPVWSILYTLIAISTWQVWEKKQFTVRLPYVVLGAQLLANALWSWLFFYWQLCLIAVLEIALLWLLIVINAANLLSDIKTGWSAVAALSLLGCFCSPAGDSALDKESSSPVITDS
ncbi:MAG: tryptophan-rich sensory protein, partial [Pseudomonadales bacterium]|nr:tryptophan-rich sensory protein [Pseudomonadales bacterium]